MPEPTALATWREKLAFLQRLEAIEADSAKKFQLKKEIEEARAYAEIWSPKHPLVTPELLAEVQALDMQAIPWTVNEPARMRELITMGVDGIITDYPDLLLQLIGRAPTP